MELKIKTQMDLILSVKNLYRKCTENNVLQQNLNVMRTLGQNRKVCVYLPAGRQVYDVAKSYGFSFRKEKINQNNKLWLADQTETQSFLACPTCHSQTVSCKYSKILK